MGDFFSQNEMQVIIVSLMAFSVVLLVIIVLLWAQVLRFSAKYRKLLNGSSTVNIEGLLMDMQQNINSLSSKGKEQEQAILDIRTKLKRKKGNMSVHRYNAFSNAGSDLSFSIAILDDEKDGVVLSGIYNREQTYLYAKPVEKGDSSYSLTPEEKASIAKAES